MSNTRSQPRRRSLKVRIGISLVAIPVVLAVGFALLLAIGEVTIGSRSYLAGIVRQGELNPPSRSVGPLSTHHGRFLGDDDGATTRAVALNLFGYSIGIIEIGSRHSPDVARDTSQTAAATTP
jgi:hypothetical protein